MKIDNNSQIKNISISNKDFPAFTAQSNNSFELKNIDEVPTCSANEIYFKSLLHKNFSSSDVLKLLKDNGYVEKNGVYHREFSEEDRMNAIFALYPEIAKNYENDKDNVDKLINNQILFENYLTLAATTVDVCKLDLEQSDIKNLSDFANLANGKVGVFLKNDFKYTMFIFKLMLHNNIFDRFMSQAKKQPALLNSLLQILENKPSLEEFKSLNNYKSLSAFSINSALRKASNDDSSSNEFSPVINLIDTYMNKSELKTPMELIRGDNFGILYSLLKNENQYLLDELRAALNRENLQEIDKVCSKIKSTTPELLNKGYISTSIDIDLNRDIRWNLNVKSGVKGVYVDLMNLLSKSTASENEIMLQRDTKFKVTDFKYDPQNKQIVIDADVYNAKDDTL